MEVVDDGAITQCDLEPLLEKPMELDPGPMQLASLRRLFEHRHQEIAYRSSFILRERPLRGLLAKASMPPRLNISIQSRTIRSLRL